MEAAHLREQPAGVMAKQIVLSFWAEGKKFTIDFGLRVVSAFFTIHIMVGELLFCASTSHSLLCKPQHFNALPCRNLQKGSLSLNSFWFSSWEKVGLVQESFHDSFSTVTEFNGFDSLQILITLGQNTRILLLFYLCLEACLSCTHAQVSLSELSFKTNSHAGISGWFQCKRCFLKQRASWKGEAASPRGPAYVW